MYPVFRVSFLVKHSPRVNYYFPWKWFSNNLMLQAWYSADQMKLLRYTQLNTTMIYVPDIHEKNKNNKRMSELLSSIRSTSRLLFKVRSTGNTTAHYVFHLSVNYNQQLDNYHSALRLMEPQLQTETRFKCPEVNVVRVKISEHM